MTASVKLFLFMKKRAEVAFGAWDGASAPARLTVCEAFADAAGGRPLHIVEPADRDPFVEGATAGSPMLGHAGPEAPSTS